MADGLNKVMLIGNLGADPEMKFSANGTAITNFRMAVNRTRRTPDGERRSETDWFTIVTFNQTAEFVGTYLRKGGKVYVEGRLQNRSWDTPDGQKRYVTEVVANQVMALDRPQGGAAPLEDGAGDVEPEDLPFD
jgi:single-strand DNA-binding protein